MGSRTPMTLAEGMVGTMEGGHGTVIARGGRFGGWSLYVKNGVPAYDYNFLGLQHTSVTSAKKLAAGKAELRMQFDDGGGGPGTGGMATLFVNGSPG